MLNNKQCLILPLANIISRNISPYCSNINHDHNKKIKISINKLQ